MTKFKAKDKTKIKNRFKKTGLVSEVEDNGNIFFYESEKHKTKIKEKKKKIKDKKKKMKEQLIK